MTARLLVRAAAILTATAFTFAIPMKRAEAWSLDTPLSEADASFYGEDFIDRGGNDVAGVGDVNGDGVLDFAISAPGSGEAAEAAGQIYLFFGGDVSWEHWTPLESADASFLGENESDFVSLVSGGSDLNGDGYDDIAFSSYCNAETAYCAGQVYVVLGRPSGWTSDMSLTDSDASFLGEAADDRAGESIASLGDVDGDGLGDLLIGAQYHGGWTGKAYLVLGTTGGWAMDTPLGEADTSFAGEYAGDLLGSQVGGGGDVNGDGLDDMLIGAQLSSEGAWAMGQVYLVLGSESGWDSFTWVDDAANASFLGECCEDGSHLVGRDPIAIAEDVDGDGLDELLIGSFTGDYQGLWTGIVYMVFGRASGWSMDRWVSDADVIFHGEYPGSLGDALASAGDVDGDGLGDLLLGDTSNQEAGQSAGQTYLIFGSTATWPAEIQVGLAGASFLGEYELDGAGNAVAGAGDIDGDGYDDILIGAPDSDVNNHAGKAYLILGGPCMDGDGDGFQDCTDCDDGEAAVHPGAPEACDGLDNDCNGEVDDEVDLDGDGWWPLDCGGDDCDDADPGVHPDAAEDCEDDIDNDCDGAIDDEDPDCASPDDDDSADDDTSDDDTTEPPLDDCDCRSQAAPGAPGSLAATALALIGLLRRRRSHPHG